MLICGQAVGELALHFIEKYGMMVIKCPSKFELRRLCRTTGANNLVRLEPPTEGDLGYCKHVFVKEIGSTQCTIFDHEQDNSKLATIVVRGSTSNIMDDVERAIDDGINVVKSMTKDARFVPGAGAVELRLADALQQHAEAQPGLDQYAINKFGLALEARPTLRTSPAHLARACTAPAHLARRPPKRSPHAPPAPLRVLAAGRWCRARSPRTRAWTRPTRSRRCTRRTRAARGAWASISPR